MMHVLPQIDILMAVYQNGLYLAEQIDSLMKQTYSHFRLIIRDDCSTDNSLQIMEAYAKKYPKTITLLKGTENLGAKGNFSALMQYATAPYIMFCDADDVWLPKKIEESLLLMQKHEKLYGAKTPLLIHTDLSVTGKDLRTLHSSFWKYSCINPHLDTLNRLLIQNIVTGCTILMNQPLLQLACPIPKEAIMHDWWIALTASAFGHLAVLEKPTILYRQHGKNDTGAKNWRSPVLYFKRIKKAFFHQGRQELRQSLSKTITQANAFLCRYQERLDLKKKDVLENYVALRSGNAFKKRLLLLKYRYFKHSFLKNVGMFLLLDEAS